MAPEPKVANWPRTTQIIFGERRSLENVLRLVRSTRLPADRRKTEVAVLRELVALRTAELNAINPDWDRKANLVGNPATPARVLDQLGRKLPRNDYYLARALSDHPNASPKLLALLARHPYTSVRENVARHPRTPAATLRALARRRDEPLWYLVAFNPNAPPALRDQLRARLRQQGEA
jgi:hypothetical protein